MDTVYQIDFWILNGCVLMLLIIAAGFAYTAIDDFLFIIKIKWDNYRHDRRYKKKYGGKSLPKGIFYNSGIPVDFKEE